MSRTERAAPGADVLVLGAGLAGMRAAWAAAEAVPGLAIVLASPSAAPSGSSFANRNDALGMQAPTPEEAAAFAAEVLRLAPPGTARPELVRALAADAPARLAELLSLGLDFRRGADGRLKRFPGCFSAALRAVIFDHPARACAAFAARLAGLGVERLSGCAAVGLERGEDGRVCGALLADLRSGGVFTVRAKCVVAALGGPAPLFARRICGRGGTGLSYGLLTAAGARLVNAPYMQFFWIDAAGRRFVNPGDLAWPKDMAGLAASRRTHCPMAHGLADRALDLALLAGMDGRGLAHPPGGPAVFPAAQAGNGGALIDECGRTGVPGLYACGECASGMHGADRIGGGMVLAALVFGRRAGAAAAREGAAPLEIPRPEDRLSRKGGAASDGEHIDGRPDRRFLARLRRGMQRYGLPSAGEPDPQGRAAFLERLRRSARAGAGCRALLARSALAVLGEKQPQT